MAWTRRVRVIFILQNKEFHISPAYWRQVPFQFYYTRKSFSIILETRALRYPEKSSGNCWPWLILMYWQDRAIFHHSSASRRFDNSSAPKLGQDVKPVGLEPQSSALLPDSQPREWRLHKGVTWYANIFTKRGGCRSSFPHPALHGIKKARFLFETL